jgi:hypothetical protein
MSAAEALRAAHAAGVRITVAGKDLILAASSEPPSAVLVLLSQHKAEIIRILRPPSHCYGCREVDRAGEPLLPFGIEDTGHAWLHSCCWPDWYAARKAEVMAASTASRSLSQNNELGFRARTAR